MFASSLLWVFSLLLSPSGPIVKAHNPAGALLNAQLLHAVPKGTSKQIRDLLRRGAEVNARDAAGETPLIIAAISQNDTVADLLLISGADVNAHDHWGNTALSQAQSRNLMIALVQYGADVTNIADISSPSGEVFIRGVGYDKPFWERWVAAGDVPFVKIMLSRTDNKHAGKGWPSQALIVAAEFGKTQLIPLLLDSGANIDYQDSSGDTALITAAESDYTDIAQLLLTRGAAVNARARGDRGMTALIVAASRNNRPLTQRLLEKDADVMIKSKEGMTALDYAALNLMMFQRAAADDTKPSDAAYFQSFINETQAIVAMLRQKVAPLSLMDAVLLDDKLALQGALAAGVDVNSTQGSGQTVLGMAAARGDTDVATLLLDKGAAINGQEGEDGMTPLMIASVYGNTDLVRLLLRRGADTNLLAKHGQTALGFAQEKKRTDVVILLKAAGEKG